MERKIILTEDGSHTISIPEMKVTYHSIHGAIQESQHVFIEAGLKYWLAQNKSSGECRVFEMGFGTGLNALLTAQEAIQNTHPIQYETIELYPVEKELFANLNYCDQFQQPNCSILFGALLACRWEVNVGITPYFSIKKINASLFNYSSSQLFNIIYFDAFNPNVQPELWTKEIFDKMFSILQPGGVLVTYSSKGDIRRAMEAAGFTIEKIPGAKGKREMIRATKPGYSNE